MEMPVLQTPSKTHTWTLVLLVWVIALLIFVAGYMMYRTQGSSPALSPAELADACAEAVNDRLGILEEEKGDDETAACPTTSASESYADGLGAPITFDFPDTWNVYTMGGRNAFTDIPTTTIDLSPLPLGDCTECGGYFPYHPITIATKTYYGSFIAKRTTDGADATLIELSDDDRITISDTTTKSVGAGTLTTFSYDVNDPGCDAPGCVSQGQYEMMIFETTTYVVDVLFTDDAGSSADNDAWDMVTSSIDFTRFK